MFCLRPASMAAPLLQVRAGSPHALSRFTRNFPSNRNGTLWRVVSSRCLSRGIGRDPWDSLRKTYFCGESYEKWKSGLQRSWETLQRHYQQPSGKSVALSKKRSRLQAVMRLQKQLDRERQDHQDILALIQETPEQELKSQFRAELDSVQQQIYETETELLRTLIAPTPSQQDSHHNFTESVIMEIRQAVGGNEAAIFAADLTRMYQRYAQFSGWKFKVLDVNELGQLKAYKDITFNIQGADAFKKLQYEAGIHRIQRVPVTEASGRVHTSTVSVAVFPERNGENDFQLNPKDLKIEIRRSQGPGGQAVNTTDSAVRITHLPTGIVVQNQNERDQHANKAEAMRVLSARVAAHYEKQVLDKELDARKKQIGSGEWCEKIRTYTFTQNRCADHRIGYNRQKLDQIMEGEEALEELFTALVEFHEVEKAEAVIQEYMNA